MRTPLLALALYLLGAALGAGWAVISTEAASSSQSAPIEPGPASASAAASARASPEPAPAPLRVLMLGNGILRENDLAGIVAGLAAADGLAPFEAVVDGPGGFSLARHVAAGRYRQHLSSGSFDFVLLQEQSQQPAFTRDRRAAGMDRSVRELVAATRAAGARPALFTTWARLGGDPGHHPGDSYDAMQERVIAAYSELAAEHRALRVPVGDVWQRIRHARSELALWKADGSHPTLLGTYLAACTVYAALYDHAVSENTYTAGVDSEVAAWIREAVDATLRVSPRPPRGEPVPGIVAAGAAGSCPRDYEPVDDVCVHRALAVPTEERLRLVISFKAGLAAPVVQP